MFNVMSRSLCNRLAAFSEILKFQSSAVSIRNYSHNPEQATVDFDYVKNATKSDNILIIDVREPDEIIEHGKIPNSINIPLSNVSEVLSNSTATEFKNVFGKNKPMKETEMIFYCMIGKRSGKAQNDALKLGFKKSKNYLGSWNDWANNLK